MGTSRRTLRPAPFHRLALPAALMVLGTLQTAGGKAAVFAQDSRVTETLIQGDVDHALRVAPATKFSIVEGEFANFTGLTVGLVVNDRFLIGVSGFGLTHRSSELTMGYGGLVLEYTHRPHKLVHYSLSGLVGGGEASRTFGRGSRTIAVVEPEARLTLNLTARVRLGFGVGYRFVGNTANSGFDLGGPVGSFQMSFDFLQDK